MSSDVGDTVAGLQADGQAAAIAAFRKALGNCESVAKDLCPLGQYGGRRGRSSKTGGDLRQSLRVEFIGASSNELLARCISSLAYAGRQHDEVLWHPGLYSNAAQVKYAARFFEAAVETIFEDKPLYNPRGLAVTEPAHFKELLDDQT